MGSPIDQLMLTLAASAVDHHVRGAPPPPVDLDLLPPELRAPGASFVTLHARGSLRGCIGSLQAVRPLATDITTNAVAAASRDPRFSPVRPDELAHLDVEVSVLSAEEPVDVTGWSDLLGVVRPGVHGITVRSGTRRATLLPTVWDQLPTPEEFVGALWRKAGLAPGRWEPGTTVCSYTTHAVSDTLESALAVGRRAR